MINTIILGHALDVLPQLPAESVSCVITSPPYWGLRDYGVEPIIWDGDKDCKHDFDKINRLHPTRGNRGQGVDKKYPIRELQQPTEIDSNFCLKCNAWRGSLGLEPTFELYIKHLCDIFDEVKRVLRKDGTCWVNLGDTYGGSVQGWGASKPSKTGFQKPAGIDERYFKGKPPMANIMPKSLIGIPERFKIEMMDNRGWTCRNTIIWHKPNCMPSSAKDRFTVDFEYVYFFVKNKKYWFEQQFEEFSESYLKENRPAGVLRQKLYPNSKYVKAGMVKLEHPAKVRDWQSGINKRGKDAIIKIHPERGRNKRTVWTVPTQSFPEAHFAVYPETLIETMIKAGCPEFICKKCGKAKMKIYKSEIDLSGENFNERQKKIEANIKSGGEKFKRDYLNDPKYKKRLKDKEIEIIETDCGCNAGWESGIVLDPFMGSGTSALVALKQRKRFIGIEIKQEYIDMSYKRIAQVQQRIF